MSNNRAVIVPLSDAELGPLPRILLQRILSLIDTDSLPGVASVNSEFRETAAAVRSAVDLKLQAYPRTATRTINNLKVYLQHHGSHLTSVKLHASHDYCRSSLDCKDWNELRSLPPLPNLQQLSFDGFNLQLGPDSASTEPGVLAAVTFGPWLTLLSMQDFHLLDGPAGLSAVASLKHLHLCGKHYHHQSPLGQASTACIPGNLLSVLVQLTHLTSTMPVSSLEHLSCLTNLQELRLPSGTPSDLTALQHTKRLTQLALAGFEFELSTSPAIAGPTPGLNTYMLTHLELEVSGEFDAAIRHAVEASGAAQLLGPLTQLQHLHLYKGRAQRDALTRHASEAVLAQLAEMTQLTRLELECMFDKATSPPAFSAVTASSKLQYLSFTKDDDYPDTAPFAAMWMHVFKPGLHLPELHTLKLAGYTHRQDHAWMEMSVYRRSSNAVPCWQDQCLSCLASCCPRLQDLDVVQALPGDVSLTPLLQLPHLTSLNVQCVSDADAWQCWPLLATAGLQKLVVGRALENGSRAIVGCITAAGLGRLSALTHLSLTGFYVSRENFNREGQHDWADAAAEAFKPYCVTSDTMMVVAGLTRLQELELHDHEDVCVGGILRLTALRQLTRLLVIGLREPDDTRGCVDLPSVAWSGGITCNKPLWPDMLEYLLNPDSKWNAVGSARQAVLANRQALLTTLGPELAAALPRWDTRIAHNRNGAQSPGAPGRATERLDQLAGSDFDNAAEAEATEQAAGNDSFVAGLHQTAAPAAMAADAAELSPAGAVQQEETRTLATALRDRLPKLVQLLASNDEVTQPAYMYIPLTPYELYLYCQAWYGAGATALPRYM